MAQKRKASVATTNTGMTPVSDRPQGTIKAVKLFNVDDDVKKFQEAIKVIALACIQGEI